MGLVNAAACIGRVGALAVALGIGAAMTSGIGIAWADESSTSEQHATEVSKTQDSAGQPASAATKDEPSKEPAPEPESEPSEAPERASTDVDDPEPAESEDSLDPGNSADSEESTAPEKSSADAEPESADSVRPEKIAAKSVVELVSKKAANGEAAEPEPAAPAFNAKSVVVAAVVEPVATKSPAEAAPPTLTAKALVTATASTEVALPATLTAWFQFLVYTPLHALAQLWITSAIGREVDNLINWAAGSYVIGNGAAGTAAHSSGGAGGWLLGDGGAGWNSDTDGVSGGAGGAGGMLGDGGAGGFGGAGAAGGVGGAGGWVMGVGGTGGFGGDGLVVGGNGGAGGAATGLVFGVGGAGGAGGDGPDGGRGGRGGNGAQVLGSGGDGGAAGDSGADATALPALGGAGGNAGSLGSHGKVGASGTGGVAVNAVSPSGILAITPTGMTLTNSAGQVVILHGFNEVYKLSPYTPSSIGFGEDDAAFLAANGFNVMRVGIIWAGVEPEPGIFDADYIASIRDTVNVLAGHGIYSIIDMHQDLYSEAFSGEGAPDWATLTGGQAGTYYGFPWSYFLDPVQQRAWDAFWSNASAGDGVGLEDHYAKAWQHIASAFAGNNAVIGYDIMNEPFVGSDWLPALLGSPFFGNEQLAPMYNQVTAAIRSVDSRTPVIIEPPVTDVPALIVGRQMNLGTMDDTKVIVAFHNYCSGEATAGICGWLSNQQANTAAAYGVAHNVPMIMDEFGASDQAYDLVPQRESADKYLMSWMEWTYSGVGDITTAGSPIPESLVYDPHLPPTGANVNATSLKILASPYPQAISGTPVSFSNAGGTFTFKYSTAKIDGSGTFAAGSKTVIAVPAVAFPNGYQVSVTGGHVVATTNTSVLTVASDSAVGTVTVVVTANI